ncbi:hypothetical protein IAR55_000629 [Kwoniella newhampshirensis]|uniref:PWI domain-containing protein n=1 Tax=Kwoniella newhampshirensis TaxID=1651941 RepID=A0AAW0Z8C5_9TREE
MADAGMRGSNASQDTRFKDKEAASIKATKFPKHFSEKVDLRKVNLSVMRGWIAQKVTELIKIEDDVVVEYVFGMLEDKENPTPDPRKMQVSLVGFMDKHGAAAFMDALWKLLLSAQSTVGGVPAEFIEAKKAELQAKQAEDKKMQDSMMARNQGRPQASDSFDRRRDGNGLPSRPGGPPDRQQYGRRSPPPRNRDDNYRPQDRDGGYRNRPPPRRGDFDQPRERDNGYGARGGYGGRGGDRPRSRSRSPPPVRGGGYRRRSPSPRRRSPSPPTRRRRSPSPRRRSPSPRRKDRSITPPLRTRRAPSEERGGRGRDDTPPLKKRRDSPDSRSPSSSPPPRAAVRGRGRPRSRSRTPTPSDPRTASPGRSKSRSRSVSRSRSPTVTPPRRRLPPRRSRSRSDSRSLPPKRRRPSPSPSRSKSASPRRERGVVKKGRGRFTVDDEEEGSKGKKVEGALGRSKWARDD